MSHSPQPDGSAPGERVVLARRHAGMTAKELGDALGVSLWEIERLECGEADAAGHVERLASVTGKPPGWFDGSASVRHGDASSSAGGEAEAKVPSQQREAVSQSSGRWLVVGSLAVLIVIRFLTEVAAVVPRAANFIDIPIFALLLVVAAGRPRPQSEEDRRAARVVLPGAIAGAVCIVATLANLTRVDIGPVLVFLYGFLGPMLLYVAAYRVWEPGGSLFLSRALVAFGVLQVATVAVLDLPRFLSTDNPDDIAGTFGENAYQLVFFLLVLVALLAGIFTFEPRRFAARAAPALLAAFLAIMLLAQYRAVLATAAMTIILIGLVLGRLHGRGVAVAAFAAAALVGAFSYLADEFPILKFERTLEVVRADPTFYVKKRLEAASAIDGLYAEEPRFVLTGTGPGTYSSRAWRTFAAYRSRSESNVAGAYVAELTGGREYRTDVADKYVVPVIRQAEVVDSSRTLASPFSSYFSLLAEIGVVGWLLIVAAYAGALLRSIRLTLATARQRVPDDPLPALFLASAAAFFVLLQMALFENWLEVARVTFLTWILFAVANKEWASRAGVRAG